MPAGFGTDSNLRSSMFGCATQTQICIENSLRNRYSNYTENEKKRQYSRRVLEVEQGTFKPLVFTSTGGMADECKRFHSRLGELLPLKKGDDYATNTSWMRAKVSFAILRSAFLCLRGTRSKKGAVNVSDIDITSESVQARISAVIFISCCILIFFVSSFYLTCPYNKLTDYVL